MSQSLFDLYFPLPFRICFTVIIGIYSWAVNVQLLTKANIDVEQLVRYKHQSKRTTFYNAIYDFGNSMAAIVTLSWVFFAILVRHHKLSEKGLSLNIKTLVDLLPVLTLFTLMLLFIFPRRSFHSAGRRRFLDICKRISLGGLDKECRFADILIADVFTSYNKVFLDFIHTIFIFFAGQTSLTNPNRTFGGKYASPIALAIPPLIRFSQCCIDYSRTGATIHLLNCLKYASSFPIIITALLLKQVKESSASGESTTWSESTVFNMWVLSCLINSVYSFYWDVTNDWSLELFTDFPKYKNMGLRSVRVGGPKRWYFFAIAVDFALRVVWMLKLTISWQDFPDLETGLFVLENLEILRRAIWVYFRTEKEWVYSGSALKNIEVGLPLVELAHNHEN